MTLLPLLLLISPLQPEGKTEDVRLVMLTAAAAQLCFVSQMPAEEQHQPRFDSCSNSTLIFQATPSG